MLHKIRTYPISRKSWYSPTCLFPRSLPKCIKLKVERYNALTGNKAVLYLIFLAYLGQLRALVHDLEGVWKGSDWASSATQGGDRKPQNPYFLVAASQRLG